jgi:cellobiose phosphorylase
MRYGRFDDKHREYVIERPDTPLPWVNYLGCEAYFGLISNTAGGYSFYQDARLRRINRFRYNNAPLDASGRMIYLRLEDPRASTEPVYWSPTWQPVRRALDEYECRHGLGYSVIRSRLGAIAASVRYFVPLGENLEVWDLRLTNQGDRRADLSVFSAVEFCLWDAWDDQTNYQRNLSIGEVEVEGGVIYHKTEYRERRNHYAYFACSRDPEGFDTQREAFLGPYRGWESPAAVESGKTSNSIAHGWQPIGAHHVRLDLPPGGDSRIIFVLGYHENPPEEKFDPPASQTVNKRSLRPILERYRQPAEVDAAFEVLREYWDGLLSRFQVRTPDPDTNRTLNIWNGYQMMATFNISRAASAFESGIGRGIGFRDSCQDLLGFVHLAPVRARRRLLDLASTQLPNGGTYHQYQPLTKRGNHAIGSGFHDDPLWLILATAAYLKETGGREVLDELVPYDNTSGTETPLYEHLQRALRFTLDRLGPHGLPLIGRADWNDCLNLNCFSDAPGESFQTTANKDGKVAESVFLAGLFLLASQEMIGLARFHGRPAEVSGYRQAAVEMEKAVWNAGWDGQWFRRAFDDSGRPVGSMECDEGQIYIEPQGICVMAGLGIGDGRAQAALDSVAARLATPHGLLLQQPAYSRYYLHLGEISSYPPGYKENAGIFCHTNPWIMIAETRIGRGDQAFDYYRRINPSVREAISEVHRCEPYVFAQMIAGRDAAAHGEAKNSWLTGSAAWAFVAMTQWILGLRPEYGGLRIDPCIPSSWDGFTARREFRGRVLRIEVRNPHGVCQGVTEVKVDGQLVPGNIVSTTGLSEREHSVEVLLGP